MNKYVWDETAEIGDSALEYVLQSLDFRTVVDIGCGRGRHSEKLRQAGKNVTSLDSSGEYAKAINTTFEDWCSSGIDTFYDLIWCSHVLEHVKNVNQFLSYCRDIQRPGNKIAITVPPLKHEIVGGHLTLWNAGLVMYNLVLARYNCNKSIIKQCGYNITVVAEADNFDLPHLNNDRGDIEKIAQWLPENYNYQGFNGDIKELNIS